MKKRIGIYRTRNVSGKFWLAVGITVLLCAGSRFQGDTSNTDVTVLQAYFTYSRAELLQLGEGACAYQALMGFRDMEWFVAALPLIAAFPTIYDFAEQWFGGSYYQLISRKTRFQYAAGNMWKAAVSGFFTTLVGVLVYGGLLYIKFPTLGEYQLPRLEDSMLAMAYGATDMERSVCFLRAVFHVGMLSAVAAMICTVLVIVLKDRFLAVSLPVLTEYFSIKLAGVYMNRLYEEYGFSAIPLKKRLIELLLPSSHLYYDNTFQNIYGVAYGYYLILLGVIILLIFAFFWWLIERRSE